MGIAPELPTAIDARIQQYVDRLGGFQQPSERMTFLIGLGRALAPPADVDLTEERRLTGCQSRVWLWSSTRASAQQLWFEGASDSVLMSGILAIFLDIVNGASAAAVSHLDDGLIAKLGLETFVAPGRGNGLKLILRHIRTTASATMQAHTEETRMHGQGR